LNVIRLPLLATLALAGCQQPAADNGTAANQAAPAPTENYIAQIDKLAPAQLQLVLFRAIRDSGQDCQNTTKVERLPDLDGRPLWRVTCRGGGQFAVQIGVDGVANVTAPKPR
jgi:hypothetical protein